MKILFIITRADTLAGAQVHIKDLSQNLLREGHDVLVITGTAGKYSELLQQANIQVVSCQALKRDIRPLDDLRSLLQLRNLIHQYQPDLVSTHSSKAGILGRWASRSIGIPCLFTAHGWTFTEGIPNPQRTIYRQIERLAEPLAKHIICVSEYDRQIGIANGMNPRRLITIHNGMPDVPAKFHAKPASGSPVRLVMIARFDQQKDHSTLLHALKSVPNVNLDLVGDGPKFEEIQNLVQDLALTERVHFLGFRQDINEILANAHIFTLISHWEGFPRTTLEAMRASLPAIVSDVGGASEAIIEGETGFCIPRGDVNYLAHCLSLLADDATLRSRLGKAARQHYLEHFTFQSMFEKTFQTYEQILLNPN